MIDTCQVKLSHHNACNLGTWGCIEKHDEMETADLTNHHIEGWANAAQAQGIDSYFNVPLISEILPGLWMGGCRWGAILPEDFDLVVSMYPWERYTTGDSTKTISFEAYDGHEVPECAEEAAQLAYDAWKEGKKVLIHCQAGLNRSGLVTARVLMKDGHSAEDAIKLLREKRCKMVLCNGVFFDHLLGVGT